MRDSSLPRGVVDYVQEESQYIDLVERSFLHAASMWGYNAVRPAILEYEDSLLIGIDKSLGTKMFRVDDWQTGKMLALAPDITPQIARISATRLQNMPLPHRLSYIGRVLRHTESQSGVQRELLQVGVELIGDSTSMADVEVITVALSTMKQLGLKLITLNISHPMFAKGVFDSFEINAELLLKIKKAVSRKDSSELNRLIRSGNLCGDALVPLQILPKLFGGVEVLSVAEKQPLPQVSKSALQEIRCVVEALNKTQLQPEITVDLGDTRGLGYHSGVTFEGYSSYSKKPLFTGGRYDNLLCQYGKDAPATGVTCNTTVIASVIKSEGLVSSARFNSVLVWGCSLDNDALLKIVVYLQDNKCVVTINRNVVRLSDAVSYATINNISKVLTAFEYNVVLMNVDSGSESTFNYDDYKKILAWTLN